MDIRTTMFNTARAAVWERAGQYGADLYQVSSHNGARPLCYPWQGKVISRSGASGETEDLNGNKIRVYAQGETSIGQAAGLFGVNCRHYPMAFIPKFSTLKGRPQDPKENAEAYELSQQQRGLERKLREENRDLAVMKAQGAGEDEIRAQQQRVSAASSRINEFCDEHGLPRRKNREYTPIDAKFPPGDSYDPTTFPTEQRDRMQAHFGGRAAAAENVKIQLPDTNGASTGLDFDYFDLRTTREISSAMSTAIGRPVDLQGMDRTLAARTARLYTDLTNDYGMRASSIGMNNRRAAFGQVNHKYTGEKKLTFSKSLFESTDKLREVLMNEQRKGQTIPIRGGVILDYVQTHEFAHLFGSSLEDGYYNINQPFWREIGTVMQEYIDDRARPLGKYAAQNIDEFMAEAFADGYLNRQPTQYGKRVKAIVDKYFLVRKG
jgi:hypothetical protein